MKKAIKRISMINAKASIPDPYEDDIRYKCNEEEELDEWISSMAIMK